MPNTMLNTCKTGAKKIMDIHIYYRCNTRIRGDIRSADNMKFKCINISIK